MSYKLICKGINFNFDINKYISTSDGFKSLDTVNTEHLKEYIRDVENDILWETLASLYPIGCAQGSFNYDETVEFFITETQRNIERRTEEYMIHIVQSSEIGKEISKISISGAEILLEMLEEESTCGEFDAKISGYIEDCLNKYVTSSRWQMGYLQEDGTISVVRKSQGKHSLSTPVLFFGIPDMPVDGKWSIKSNEALPGYWFEEDQWSLMEFLVDNCSDCFLTWYLAECGNWVPDMLAIIESCPILFEENDSVSAVNQKMNDFFDSITSNNT